MIELAPRPAIASAPVTHGDLSLTAPHGGAVIQIMGRRGDDGLATRLRAFVPDQPHALRVLSPDQWLLVLAAPPAPDELARLREIAGDAALVDQSSGRARIRIEGKRAVDVLAQHTAVDLHPSMFAVGNSAATLFGHISGHLTRVGDDAYEILVLRGFAASLWEALAESAG
ncbi:MAG: sarcosine oxidase subunit gamma [Rhizobiaceae bacterium]